MVFVHKVRTSAPLLPSQEDRHNHPMVNADPFPSIEEHRTHTVEHRQLVLTDYGLWCQQWIGEVARMARILANLRSKLQDPSLADDPRRDKAAYRAIEHEDTMIEIIRDVAWIEAESDRIWQSLDVPDREAIAGHWMTNASEERLIGAAWARIATFEAWPSRFALNRQWLAGFPWPLILDLQAVNAWEIRIGPDPASDPFEEDAMP